MSKRPNVTVPALDVPEAHRIRSITISQGFGAIADGYTLRIYLGKRGTPYYLQLEASGAPRWDLVNRLQPNPPRWFREATNAQWPSGTFAQMIREHNAK